MAFVVLMDISGALDNTTFESTTSTTKRNGLKGNIYSYIYIHITTIAAGRLEGPRVLMWIGHVSYILICRGCPQDRILFTML